ncbi:hypothetical protein CsSME_00048093 [Camellia sinensis var. sinensis]
MRSQGHTLSACPSNIRWTDDGLERDLYIQTSTITVLAMDGRRRWLDIEKLVSLVRCSTVFKSFFNRIPCSFHGSSFRAKFETKGSNGKGHSVLVTNLVPCSGIRLHLWPEKGKSASDLPVRKRVLEVTQKMVHIPSGPAPRQVQNFVLMISNPLYGTPMEVIINIEPRSQTEQAPSSAVFFLAPGDMHGFRFLTISVAPSPTVSGRPPPAASMAVGQFVSPKDGELELSPQLLLLSTYSSKSLRNELQSLFYLLVFSISN